jgi:hypothetical protein
LAPSSKERTVPDPFLPSRTDRSEPVGRSSEAQAEVGLRIGGGDDPEATGANGMISVSPNSDYIDRRLEADFPDEYGIVRARLDPVLAGLAHDLFPSRDANAPTAVSALILSRCRRNLMQTYWGTSVETAAGAVFLDVLSSSGGKKAPAAGSTVPGVPGIREDPWLGVMARHTRETYNSGFVRGCAFGLGFSVAVAVALRLSGLL